MKCKKKEKNINEQTNKIHINLSFVTPTDIPTNQEVIYWILIGIENLHTKINNNIRLPSHRF